MEKDIISQRRSGINRNILECKDTAPIYSSWRTGVLIETYWNVKENSQVCRGRAGSGINRNILECKDSKMGGILVAVKSINRNILECKEVYFAWQVFVFRVLIETYWNVKALTSIIVNQQNKY